MGRFAEALEDVKRIIEGDYSGVIADTMRIADVPDFTPEEIKALRHATKMSQRVFAHCLGVSQKSIEAWESGRSHPDGAARRLLGLLQIDHDFFSKSGIYRYERKEFTTSHANPKMAHGAK